MSGADRVKDLLIAFNKKEYHNFILNDEPSLDLPSVSLAPGIVASRRKDHFKKILSNAGERHIKFITLNEEPHSFLWQTQAKNIKHAVRWGIVRPHSITGKVIAALGHYRLIAHKRMTKGLISNSHAMKMKLLDLYQNRFEALQDLESLVNKKNNTEDYAHHIQAYITRLNQIHDHLDQFVQDVMDTSGFDQSITDHIKLNLKSDTKNAQYYLNHINPATLPYNNMAKGEDSIVTFVKQQMLSGLYELQGINQDLSFSTQRAFALTRGELNDYIEDARKEIEDHQPDLVNAVTARHHGLFSADEEELITYDFSQDALSPDRERDILTGISFIDGWDKLEQTEDKSYVLKNNSGSQKLDTVSATRWINHRNATWFFKFAGHYLLRIVLSIFISTRPWEEEPWTDEQFHLTGSTLHQYTPYTKPIWQKPLRLLKHVIYTIIDLFSGVKDFGNKLTINMPDDIRNDWESTQQPPSLEECIKDANHELETIALTEKQRLETTLNECQHHILPLSPNTSILATVEYPINQGEQNDLLTSMARGLLQFGTVFSHNIFAKDPFAGLTFTAAFAAGASAIYFPAATASVLGSEYVTWFSNAAYSMGSSKLAATIAGGSSQAQVFAASLDILFHGPSGFASNLLYQAGEDPLTFGTYFTAASLLGYLLVNGVAGYKIPWLSEVLKEDLGTSPAIGYPFIGAKVAILLHESLIPGEEEHGHKETLSAGIRGLSSIVNDEQLREIKKNIFTLWLSKNAEVLPKLNSRLLFNLSRHIEALFNKEESDSLKKLLYPETQPTIAFQIMALPLSYIPALLRCIFSIPLTLYAAISGQANPYEPVKRAWFSLYEEAKKDLSRLVVFTSFALYVPYTTVTTFVKAFSFAATLIIGRIASLFHIKTGQTIYGFIGTVHQLFFRLGETIYPASIMKNTSVAHPNHTIKMIGSSYERLLSQLGENPHCLSESSDSNSQSEIIIKSLWSSIIKNEEYQESEAPIETLMT